MSHNILEDFLSKLSENKIDHEIEHNDDESPKMLTFQIKGGRMDYDLRYPIDDHLLNLLNVTNIEKINFIQDYEAIWSSDRKNIECEINLINADNRPVPTSFLLRRLQIFSDEDFEKSNGEDSEKLDRISFPCKGNIDISIGICSDEFAILQYGKRDSSPFLFSRKRANGENVASIRHPLTLKLSNVDVEQHDDAVDILRKLANSLFFQIDLLVDVPLNLVPQRENMIEKRKRRMRQHSRVKNDAKINKLKYKYDDEPISSYWNAKANSNMPLFQFLAFYQVVEFYFPIYSKIEVHKKIKNWIKDPRFNSNSDSDLSKIINIIKMSKMSNAFGNEKEQLKSTITYCVSEDEIKDFLELDAARKKYYVDRKGNKISMCHFSYSKKTQTLIEENLINEVADRIYGIRCKIVHSKSNESEYINPFSKEVNQLIYDIELVEFLARKVLIASSTSL
ncbi:hypothetical protein [Methanohalophilus halophilus]|uniref:Apea-like HEPN domain-containing protein n=1 Tax=Methanohalophilus halophilus TaxID=2177 RepID=A0A1L3Q3P1_9EURY|nr:hypothetical protein [Methanohalophilus halophilus]APH39487.1 hypothetical protein BHR79_08340 [Methanohalophilus halophilus]RNI09180.1 hypothetical protein EFE40_06935 [Methanohalophilus halophilus]SDW27779.1 hypothetical protein SAMN04515625_0576 [Methanohalophilus halophilus]